MRGLLKRRDGPAAPAPATAAPVPATAAPSPHAPPTCALLTCPHCGLKLLTLAFRCPRCLEDIPLGCSGNCHACGKART